MGSSLSDREPVAVPRSQVTIKTVAVVCAVVAGAIAIVWLVVHSLTALTLTVTSALIAVALNHGVKRLERWHVPRGVAIALAMMAVVAVLVALVWLVIPASVDQVKQLAQRAPALMESARSSPAWEWANEHARLEERITQWTQESGVARKAINPVFSVVGGMFAGVAALVTILFVVVFMLLYGGRAVRGLLAESLPRHRERYERVLRKLDGAIGGYLNGLMFIALANAVLTTTFLAIVRVPLFLALGIVSGVASVLPLVGAALAGALIALMALATRGPWVALAALAYVAAYQQFENHVLGPLVYRKTVRLNPLVTLLGVLFMAELGGVVGAVLAIPIISAAQIVVRELLLLRRERLGLPIDGAVAERVEGRGWRRRPRHA
ncbi:MAG TPA: AI-2E family transporter [Myxococcaceae bacterium]|nr:AI-2E family transporter [Myxococcaceae bacterium]